MHELTFKGLGTAWCVLVDAPRFDDEVRQAVLTYTHDFEQRFSRFLPNSEVNTFRTAERGSNRISSEFAQLLRAADRLRSLTGGVYDPAVANLLERVGYGGPLAKETHESAETFMLPKWSIVGEILTIDGPTAFDLGGMGKGYCIDGVARVLKQFGHTHFLVDGGGDMAATTKADGSAWHIAVEYPGKPDMAASMVELREAGLAVSDSFRRRFGKWHHILDPQQKKTIETVVGCAAIAPDAWAADCMTSGLFMAPPNRYPALAKEYRANYLVFQKEGPVIVSQDWPGELF